MIILENKSFDATFTGLNNNTYLWKTLPSQGTLLTNYYGTGHFSLDNYVSLVSGQGPTADDQNDCPVYKDLQGRRHRQRHRPVNDGQFVTAGTPYQANEGCVYPANVPTLFNQLDAAHVSWKGYAQDLGNPDSSGPPHDAGACGGASLDPTTNPVPNPGSANSTDQYVPKHFPFPWFHSLIDNPSDCDTAHIANLFSSTERSLPRPAECQDDAGVQLDQPEQLLGRPRCRLPREQPVRWVGQCHHAQSSGQLHRRPLCLGPLPRARHPRDRGLAGVQAERAHRHHLRRGFPGVHLHRQQLQQLADGPPDGGVVHRLGLGR